MLHRGRKSALDQDSQPRLLTNDRTASAFRARARGPRRAGIWLECLCQGYRQCSIGAWRDASATLHSHPRHNGPAHTAVTSIPPRRPVECFTTALLRPVAGSLRNPCSSPKFGVLKALSHPLERAIYAGCRRISANRSDVRKLIPNRSRQCPLCRDAACRAGRTSVDDRGRRCSHSGFRHQWPDYP
jgi:hypothetical protein